MGAADIIAQVGRVQIRLTAGCLKIQVDKFIALLLCNCCKSMYCFTKIATLCPMLRGFCDQSDPDGKHRADRSCVQIVLCSFRNSM